MGCITSKQNNVNPIVIDTVSTKRASLSDSNRSLSNDGQKIGAKTPENASSKSSENSEDSGYFGQDAQEVIDDFDEYKDIITEESDYHVVEEVERNFEEKQLDFCLVGTPAPRNISARDRARMDEQKILEDLRNEGLITTSKFEGRSGLSFEVREESLSLRRAIPPRLAKLSLNSSKPMTMEHISDKLAKAERRRKEVEAEKIEKINSVTSKIDPQLTQQEQAKVQQAFVESTLKREDSVAEKRQQNLQDLRDKLKAREEHAAKVRLRKKLHLPTQEELDAIEKERPLVIPEQK